MDNQHNAKNKLKRWLKRLGLVGFWFFLIKGLIWIAIAIIGFIWGSEALAEFKNLFNNNV